MLENTTPAPEGLVPPPPGLVYGTAQSSEGPRSVWQIDAAGQAERLYGADVSPDGRYVVYPDGGWVDDDWESPRDDDLWLADLTTGERRKLTDTPDLFVNSPTWWTGRPGVIVFTAGEHERANYLAVVGVDGEGFAMLDPEHSYMEGYSLSPDGQTIAYDSPAGPYLYRWGEGYQPFEFTSPPGTFMEVSDDPRLTAPAFSPDGRFLAWGVNAYDLAWNQADGYTGQVSHGVVVFDLATGSSSILHPYANPAAIDCTCIGPQWSPDGRWITLNEVSSNEGSAGLWVVSADGSREHFLGRRAVGPLWNPRGGELLYAQGKAFWLTTAGVWEPRQVDLEANVVFDWRPEPVIAPAGESLLASTKECPGAPPTRVVKGATARVTYTDGSPLALRDVPGLSSGRRIKYLAEGTRMTIRDGPVCQDGYAWWNVETEDGVLGWVAEGDWEAYFLEPLE